MQEEKFFSQMESKKNGKSIVLDVDETLLHSCEGEENIASLNALKRSLDPYVLGQRDRIYVVNKEDAYGNPFSIGGFLRPGSQDFLKFCLENFEQVIVWSAGQRRYVENMVNILFANLERPAAVWSFPSVERHKQGFYYKPLSKMVKALGLDLSKTYVVDNQEETFVENPKNAIHIPNYEPTCDLKGLKAKDTALSKVQEWLSKNAKAADVLSQDKTKIF